MPNTAASAKNFLQRLPAVAPLCNSEKPRGREQTVVVTGKLHVLLLGPNKLKRRQVNGI
jgi:hypothetical protein